LLPGIGGYNCKRYSRKGETEEKRREEQNGTKGLMKRRVWDKKRSAARKILVADGVALAGRLTG
jgi:hypothetical protein